MYLKIIAKPLVLDAFALSLHSAMSLTILPILKHGWKKIPTYIYHEGLKPLWSQGQWLLYINTLIHSTTYIGLKCTM